MTGPRGADVTRHVVVDTDAGIDDACALLYLAGHPGVEITAVTSVAGNRPERDVARNIGCVTRLLGLAPPVARGAARPLPGAPSVPRGTHGTDGLGAPLARHGLPRPMPAVTGESATELIVRLARERPGDLDLLALGPFTNLALALRIDPALFTKYRSVVLMGGSGPYDVPGERLVRDSNIARDPAAARAVATAPRADLVMLGVDVTATVLLPTEAIAALDAAGTPVARFAAAILGAYPRLDDAPGRRGGVPLHDPLAAGILLDPSLATGTTIGPVAVLPDGPLWRARLMRTAEGLPPPFPCEPAPDTRVVTAADAGRFVRDFLHTLTQGFPLPHATDPAPPRPGGR
ncbi:nucleoside hydrolase [Sphaerisporangium rhizosphaerae]|uniref:Nucleoside hydrolase n=1 Tax=Sphaerisporangium rhizosphaerae TaxID=2269375 RepID=A0ABW2PGK4_9ACTN